MGRTASQTRPAVFILRHHGEHRLYLKTLSPLAVLPGGDWWGTLPKDTRTDWRSEPMKLTQVHTAREFEARIWIRGVIPEAALNLHCAMTTGVRSSYKLSQFLNMGELKYFRSEFIPSVSICLFCLLYTRQYSEHRSYGHKQDRNLRHHSLVDGWKNESPSSLGISVGTLVNCFHKSMSGVNTADLSCKNQCFNHWFSSSSWQEQHLIPVSDSLAEHRALISASGGTSKIVCVMTVCCERKYLCTLLSIF